VYIESKTDDADLEWSATPTNDSWHTMKSGTTYEFLFDVYVRKLSKQESRTCSH
jgi:hypothetical protein